MNSQPNPILIELSQQLPDTSKTYQYIKEAKSFYEITLWAGQELYLLSGINLNQDLSSDVKNTLIEKGYDQLLNDGEDDDRLRIVGALQMIVELAEELDKD